MFTKENVHVIMECGSRHFFFSQNIDKENTKISIGTFFAHLLSLGRVWQLEFESK